MGLQVFHWESIRFWKERVREQRSHAICLQNRDNSARRKYGKIWMQIPLLSFLQESYFFPLRKIFQKKRTKKVAWERLSRQLLNCRNMANTWQNYHFPDSCWNWNLHDSTYWKNSRAPREPPTTRHQLQQLKTLRRKSPPPQISHDRTQGRAQQNPVSRANLLPPHEKSRITRFFVQ